MWYPQWRHHLSNERDVIDVHGSRTLARYLGCTAGANRGTIDGCWSGARSHTRLGQRHCPGCWLQKSCLANATSIRNAAWLRQPSPTPEARTRWCPYACSLSSRGGRLGEGRLTPSCFESFPRLRQPWALSCDLTGSLWANPSVRPSYCVAPHHHSVAF